MRIIKAFLKYQLIKGVWNAVRGRQGQGEGEGESRDRQGRSQRR
jgi:hypothetical protein